MKLFNKSNKEKLNSEFSLKYGAFGAAVIAIVLALVIALNIAVNIFNQKYPMTLDFTIYDEYTITEDNLEFLETVDYKVDLKVLFTKEQYIGGGMSYRSFVDETGKYFSQTVKLLDQYKKYNENINISWLDPNDSDVINEVSTEYSEIFSELDYGDILVDCYVSGEDEEPLRGFISAEDCYNLSTDSDASMQYYNYGSTTYTVTGNNIENAVANGIFKTANLKTVNVALITTNSSGAEENVKALSETAGYNAYEFTPCPEILETDFSKYTVMVICAPDEDYTADECNRIREWLHNDGKKGRTLLYFATTISAKNQNLSALLEEYGIGYDSDYKYLSQNEGYYSSRETNILLSSNYTDYTASVDNGGYAYISDDMVSMKAIFETNDDETITTETLFTTADSQVYERPIDADGSWKPGVGKTRDAVILSKSVGEEANSYVIAFASLDFIINEDVGTKSENGNLRAIVNILNVTSRTDEDEFVIAPKMVEDGTRTFVTTTTEAENNLVGIIFIGAIPLALIVIAIIVYIRRKNY